MNEIKGNPNCARTRYNKLATNCFRIVQTFLAEGGCINREDLFVLSDGTRISVEKISFMGSEINSMTIYIDREDRYGVKEYNIFPLTRKVPLSLSQVEGLMYLAEFCVALSKPNDNGEEYGVWRDALEEVYKKYSEKIDEVLSNE